MVDSRSKEMIVALLSNYLWVKLTIAGGKAGVFVVRKKEAEGEES